MAISKATRDRLLVEASHRCTICAEKCFEIHHIIEQADGGSDDYDNLIVLCPNCHQHRYHRSGEFTRDQILLYKGKLQEHNEIERRLLLNLEEIRESLATESPDDVEARLKEELQSAARLVSPDRPERIREAVEDTSRWLAERELIQGGARRAIEVEWDVQRQREKARFSDVEIKEVDESAWRKAPDFPAAYVLEFVLNQWPNADWIQVFMQNYQQSFYNMKRETSVRGDRIVMIVADSDNLQWHADFAKRMVLQTNQFITLHVFKEIDREIDRRKRHALEQFEAVESLKARTRSIKL